MQTISEHLTSDFEVQPIGTGRELARLADEVRALLGISMHPRIVKFLEECEPYLPVTKQNELRRLLYDAGLRNYC